MRQRALGRGGPEVSAIGLGCMSMSIAYGATDFEESMRTLDRAAELGITLLDTADAYGRGANERLLGQWGHRRWGAARWRGGDRPLVSSKFGLRHNESTGRVDTVDTSPAHVARACEASLDRLGVDHVDLYHVHRRAPEIPIEDTVGAMAELVHQGKIRCLGLSEVNADTVRRAHAVHPISAVQLEYSLFTRDVVEGGMLATCRELGISVLAYAPLGRGMLTGALTSLDDLEAEDNRRRWPRFAEDNIEDNLALVDAVAAVAARLRCTPAQAALAWLLARGHDIVPIPGSKKVRHLEDNVRAVDLTLTHGELDALDAAVPPDAVSGARYPEVALRRVGL